MIRKILPVVIALSFFGEAAVAANCTAYPLPYTLTNGTTADASQVMANLNDVINCVNALNAVTGPASSVVGHLATFANTGGTQIQDGGPFSVSAQYLANSAVALGVTMLNGTVVPSNASNALTFTIQTLAGATPSATDPVYFLFRNATAGTGNYSVISVTAALSVTIPTSSTMGFSNNTPGRIWITAINNAGTVELAVINCLTSTATSKNIYPLAGWGIVNTTALGGPSNSSGVFYSTIARSSVPYGILGFASYESGLATAGTWNANPTRMELYRPGVPLPGATIQTIYSTTTTTTTVSSTTIIATSLSASITPTSSVNLIKASAGGNVQTNANGVNFQLGRTSSSNLFGSLWETTLGSAEVGVNCVGIDNPATASSTTYSLYFGLDAGTSTATWLGTSNQGNFTPRGSLIIEEIMGALEPANDNGASLSKVG